MTLKSTLILFLVGIIFVIIGISGWLAYWRTSDSLRELSHRQFSTVSEVVEERVRGVFEPAEHILIELENLSLAGVLPLKQNEQLAIHLAERLRSQPKLAWISYSEEKTGYFLGAWRRNETEIIVNQSKPNTGQPREYILSSDGERTPLQREGLPDYYDPREKGWFKQASLSSSTVWSVPYVFAENVQGITVSKAVRLKSSAIVDGVFTVDFFTDELEKILQRLAKEDKGHVYVLSFSGEILVAPSEFDREIIEVFRPKIEKFLWGPQSAVVTEELTSLKYKGHSYLVALKLLTLSGGRNLLTIVIEREDKVMSLVYENAKQTAAIGIMGIFIAFFIGIYLSNKIAGPLHLISEDLNRISRFDLSPQRLSNSFVNEIKVVNDAAERMKAGFRSFSRYVPVDLVKDLVASGKEAKMGGETKEISFFFSDIEGFTSISESLTPQQIVEELSDYLEVMTNILEEKQGTVDKFMGDGILAFFNAPLSVEQHASKVCLASLQAQSILEEVALKREKSGQPVFRTRIGMHTGEALVGNIGTSKRFSYTVIGDAVNLASRLESLNKVYGTRILASDDLRIASEDDFEWRMLDKVAVVGRRTGLVIYELLGEKHKISQRVLSARDDYEFALKKYLNRDFVEAKERFGELLKSRSKNKAAEVLMKRCEEMITNPPESDWDGVYAHRTK